MPLGPSQQYLCRYNTYQLPGYVQKESMDSTMNIAAHPAAFVDGSLSEATGLANKVLSVTLRVWEPTYLAAKQQIETAGSMVRSSKLFAPLYLQYSDKHYSAIARSMKIDKEVGTPVRILDYDVEFECRPWLIGETQHTVTGTGTFDTDQVGRTILDGGWTPTVVTISGTNPTISAVTETSQNAGGFNVTGSVTNLIVDSDAFTATISSANANDKMATVDYRLWIGPGKTTFTTTGATSCTITYYDRWYI